MTDSTVLARPTLHPRACFSLPAHVLRAYPEIFDQGRGTEELFGARIVSSSTRFDRDFGNMREYRPHGVPTNIYRILGEGTDTHLRGLLSNESDDNRGVGRFLQALAHCESSDGFDFLPPFNPSHECRLITYLRNNLGTEMVVEAVRAEHGFKLDCYNLDETGVWPEDTFLLTFVPLRADT